MSDRKDLTLSSADAQLTLSDGTPVRLALPGPERHRGPLVWPYVALLLVLLTTAYLVWWKQQSWLFIQGPQLVGQADEGASKALCTRILDNLAPQLQGNPDPWLPGLEIDQFTARCLNGSAQLENVTAQALNFIGYPSALLTLQAIQVGQDWNLRSAMQGRQHQKTVPAQHPIELVEALRGLSMDALDPVFAAQNRLSEGQPDQALVALNAVDSPQADLTRARALVLLNRHSEAWAIYERYQDSQYQSLARIALANLAHVDGNTALAITMLENSGISAGPLRVATAIDLDKLDWAEAWLADLTGPTRALLEAQLAERKGQPERVIRALSSLAPQSLGIEDQIRLARALTHQGQFERASALLADIDRADTQFIQAQIQFQQGHWTAALDALSRLNTDPAYLYAASLWLWDGQTTKATETLEQIQSTDIAVPVRFELALLQRDMDGAQNWVNQSSDPLWTRWAQARLDLAQGHLEAVKQGHQWLAERSPDHANHVGGLLNQYLGFNDAAAAAFASMDTHGELRRYRLLGLAELTPLGQSEMGLGEQQFGRLVSARMRFHLDRQQPALAAQVGRTYQQQRPESTVTLALLARAYTQQGLFEAALDEYVTAFSNGVMSQAESEQAAKLAEQLGAHDLTVQWLGPLADRLATDSKRRLLRGWLEMEQFAPAEHWIRRAAVLSPNDPELFVMWGQISEGTGDLVGAISKYRHALNIQPGYAPAELAWSLALESRGETNAAVKRMRQLLENPSAEADWAQVGRFFERNQLPELAIQALEKQPNASEQDRLRLATLQAKQGLNRSAHENFAKVMNPQIQDAQLWRLWGDSLAALGQTVEALDKYKVAVRLTR